MTSRDRAYSPHCFCSTFKAKSNCKNRARLLLLLLGTLLPVAVFAQNAQANNTPGLYHPLADPKAVVVVGHARFTVLTPQLIRMEWAADGRFEDHASLVFLNRELPVPKFDTSPQSAGGEQHLSIKTDALQLRYTPQAGSDGKFSADNLEISFTLNGKQVVWHPGTPDTGNLMGTTRTLDGALGNKTKEPIEPGLLSRDGWTLVDDSTRP
jgi:alpha-glucosidase